MTTQRTLLEEITAFMDRHGMPPSTFGQRAIADGKLVQDLRAGRDLRTSTVERIKKFMREYRPQERPSNRAA